MAHQARDVSKWVRLPVWIGGGLGLILALTLTGVRAVKSAEPLDAEAALGDLAFGVVYAMPFALSLWALRWQEPARQAGVWLAGGLLAFLASFSAFSGISLVFLPTAPLLILGGLLAALGVIGAGSVRPALAVLPIAAALVAVGVGAFLVLITLIPDPRCWVLNRYPDGRTVWESDPSAQIVVENLPGGSQRVFGGGGGVGGPPVNGVERISSTCTSDVVSPLESVGSLGLWALAVVGLELSTRHRKNKALVGLGG